MPRFSKAERLLKRADFLAISARGRKAHTANFVILFAQSGATSVRVGITVSRKVGSAVTRNHVKRLFREFYRLNKRLFMPADYNIIAKPGAARLGTHEICHELALAFQRLDTKAC